jgi:hypothetical protein
MSLSFTYLQGAAIIAAHSTAAKLTVSLGLRTYQFLQPDADKRASLETNRAVQDFCKAQMNDTEYSATLVTLLLFLHSISGPSSSEPSTAALLAVTGSVGYVWCRTLLSYPCIPTISFALTRYGGLLLLIKEVWSLAFAK